MEGADTLSILSHLTPGQQSVLVLIAVEGMSYAEAAEALDIPIGTLVLSRPGWRAAARHHEG